MAKAITYCIALQRFSNVSLSVLPTCQTRNVVFDAGRYLLQVYDIERNGEISTLPAVIHEILLGTSRTIVLEPSVSCKPEFNIDTYKYILLFFMFSTDALSYT